MTPRLKTQTGFTLIELLVVIAIIAVLAAILFPVFASAREKARQTACLSNMRQIGMATRAYMEDYDEKFPQTKQYSTSQPQVDDADGSIEDGPGHYDLGSIFNFIRSYVSTGGHADSQLYQEKLYFCPSDPNPTSAASPNGGCGVGNGPAGLVSYVVNGYYVWGLTDSGVGSPANSILYAERRSTPADSTQYCDDIYHPWFNPTNSVAPQNDMDARAGAIATTRHTGGSNYVFADGHVKWQKYERTYNPTIGLNLHIPQT